MSRWLTDPSWQDGRTGPARPSICFSMVLTVAAMVAAGIGVQRILFRPRRRRLRPYQMTGEQRRLLADLICRGEERRWDFSYDEDFLFSVLPALKSMVR